MKKEPITITENNSGIKLNRWIQKTYPNLTLSHLNKLVRTGQIRVNGGRVKFNTVLNSGDELRLPPFIDSIEKDEKHERVFTIPRHISDQVKKQIIFEDDTLVIVNKPAGIPCQAGGTIQISMDRIMQKLYKDIEIRMTHRLDKETSGILIFAKTFEATKNIANQFKAKTTIKKYIALTNGVPEDSAGSIKIPLLKKGPKIIADPKGKEAETDYKTLWRTKNSACLEITPKTGRTHQIRVHLATVLGCPIIGDSLYNNKTLDKSTKETLHLTAYEITIQHPKTGMDVTFNAPYPVWAKQSG